MENCVQDYEMMVMRELGNVVSKGELNPADMKNLGEAIDIVKDLYTIDAMKQSSYGSYSGAYMNEHPEMDYPVRGNSSHMYDDRRYSYRNGGGYNRGYDGRIMW